MFIDLDTSKKCEFGAMIYHLKRDLAVKKYSAIKVIEPILFLN